MQTYKKRKNKNNDNDNKINNFFSKIQHYPSYSHEYSDKKTDLFVTDNLEERVKHQWQWQESHGTYCMAGKCKLLIITNEDL